MIVKLKDEEKNELINIEDSINFNQGVSSACSTALRSLTLYKGSFIRTLLLNHGVVKMKIKNIDLQKGEIEISNIKVPTKEELGELERKKIITPEQAKKIEEVKK